LQAVPKVIASLMEFNPVYVISSAYRAALVDQARPDLLSLAVVGLVSMLGLWISLGAFRRVKGFFPSVV
jgi:ABC-type polysaccharide/polyol phosphate export permease